MQLQINKLAQLVPQLEQLVLDVPWSEKHKIINIKNKGKLLLEFSSNDEKAKEVKNEIDGFIDEVTTLINDINNELEKQGA
jgi:ArsR family metal-binding transcriptional regulator